MIVAIEKIARKRPSCDIRVPRMAEKPREYDAVEVRLLSDILIIAAKI